MKPTAPLVAFALMASIPAVARADSARPDGTYKLTGDVSGHFEGKLVVEPREDGSFLVTTTEERSPAVTWSGPAKLEGRVLTIERSSVGIVGALDRSNAAAVSWVCTFDDKLENASVIVKQGSQQLGTAALSQKQSLWDKIPGELLGLAEKEVDRAVHKEIDLTREFDVLEYGHIGVKTGVQLIETSNESALMKESDTAFRAAGKGEPIWVRSFVEGGPRVAYSASIPIDPNGTVRVDAGFQLGGQVHYECDDQEKLPEGFTDAKGALHLLEDVPARVFALPLTASRAEELPEGTRRTLQGNGALALSGGVTFGYKLEELGALEKKATVGLNGGLSVTWNIHGNLELDIERQQANLIHVRWTKTGARELGAGVQALLGMYVSDSLLAKVPSPEDKAVTAVVQQGEHYTSVSFNASADWLKQSDLAIDMLFDLSDPDAREAYERAVVGDLLAVQKLADKHVAGGLEDYHVTSTLTDALSFHAELKAFQLLDASTDRRTANIHVEISSLDGSKSTTDTFDYSRSGHGLFGDSKSLTAESIARTVVHPTAPTETGERATFHFSGRDDRTWKDEMLASLRLGALLFGQNAVAKEWNLVSNDDPPIFHHYGASDMTLDVTLGSKAIAKILSVSYDDLVLAYGTAHWEHDYVWSPERVAQLEATSLVMKNDATQEEEALRLEAWDFYDAEKVLKLVQKARRAGTSMKDRVQAFRDIAKKDGFELRAVVAFALVAGSDDTHVAWTLKDSNWLNLNLARGQASALPNQP